MARSLSIILSLFFVAGIFSCASAAISCMDVNKNIAHCASYLTSKSPLTSDCCTAVKSLNSAASTTADRQTACGCLKALAIQLASKLDVSRATALPSSCGVKIPYPISSTTDCTKVT